MKVVFCPVQFKKVGCERDGVCERAGNSKQPDICSIMLKAFALSDNVQEMSESEYKQFVSDGFKKR